MQIKTKKVFALICAIAVSIAAVGLSVSKINRALASADGSVKNKPLIIIDAGHGGFDGGCVASDGTYEKDINLALSLQLNELLMSLGFDTLLVRDTDCSVETEGSTTREKKRSDIMYRYSLMDENRGCVYLCIHQNMYSSPSSHGAQVFYTPDNDRSQALAQSVQSNIIGLVQQNNTRLIKQCTSDVYIINKAPDTAVAVLIECGFMSNPADLADLKKQEYRGKISLAIASGLMEWLKTN